MPPRKRPDPDQEAQEIQESLINRGADPEEVKGIETMEEAAEFASKDPLYQVFDDATRQMTEELARPVDPKYVRRREGSGGKSFDYIAGQDAIREANRVFGWGNWSSQIRELRLVQSTPESKPMWIAIARVNAYGGIHEGIGFAVVQGNPSLEQNVETAIKGAETDAVKRALRYFGEALGNSLYPDAEEAASSDGRQTPRSQSLPADVG